MLSSKFEFLLSALFLTIIAANHNTTKCPGPLAYYESLNCKPIRHSHSDVCAYKYDCDFLERRSKNKCYVNGKVYNIGDRLREEDANPCDIRCSCALGYDDVATFNCAIVDCFQGDQPKGNCYRQNSPLECCPGELRCPEKPEDRAECNVEGKIYKDGEYFQIDDKSCTCQPHFKGEYVEPFCASPKHPYCSPDFRHASDIVKKCAPVYYSSQSLQTGCSVFSRCQNSNDTIIKNKNFEESSDDTEKNMKCYFGDMLLNLGDELNSGTDYNSVCVKCICEVPPVLSCQRLSDEECDVTNHPPFAH